jgi:hypothetical protein
VSISTGSGWTGQVEYDWEPDGAIGRVTTTWAGAVDYHYDAPTGALLRIDDVATGSALAVFPLADRDPLGRAGRIELAGGGLIEASWDGNGRVTDWYVESGTGASEARAYVYDDRGRLESQTVTTSVGTREDEFGYQEPGWLTTETVDVHGVFGLPETRVYDYDAAGNRTQRTVDGVGEAVHTYAYGNRLTDVGAASVTWDGLGGITEDHRGYTFDRNPAGWRKRLGAA